MNTKDLHVKNLLTAIVLDPNSTEAIIQVLIDRIHDLTLDNERLLQEVLHSREFDHETE